MERGRLARGGTPQSTPRPGTLSLGRARLRNGWGYNSGVAGLAEWLWRRHRQHFSLALTVLAVLVRVVTYGRPAQRVRRVPAPSPSSCSAAKRRPPRTEARWIARPRTLGPSVCRDQSRSVASSERPFTIRFDGRNGLGRPTWVSRTLRRASSAMVTSQAQGEGDVEQVEDVIFQEEAARKQSPYALATAPQDLKPIEERGRSLCVVDGDGGVGSIERAACPRERRGRTESRRSRIRRRGEPGRRGWSIPRTGSVGPSLPP